MSVWSSEPPTVGGWYWCRLWWPAEEEFTVDVDEMGSASWGGWTEYGPRIPSPEELAAMRECCKALHESVESGHVEDSGAAALRKLEEAKP